MVTTSRELTNTSVNVNLYGRELLSPLTLTRSNVYIEEDINKYITVKALLVRVSHNSSVPKVQVEQLGGFDFVPCKQITDKLSLKFFEKLLVGRVKNHSLCPDYSQINYQVNLTEDQETQSSTSLTVRVFPCSLPDPTQCAPFEMIHGTKLNFAEMSNLISPSNYKKPVQFRALFETLMIDVYRAKSLTYALKKNMILDDRFEIRKPEVRAAYGVLEKFSSDSWNRENRTVYCTEEQIFELNCEEYAEFFYEVHSDTVVTTRSYMKISALAGQFGGVLKLLSMLTLAFSFYSAKSVNSYIQQKLFPVHQFCAQELDGAVSEALEKRVEVERRVSLRYKKTTADSTEEPAGVGQELSGVGRGRNEHDEVKTLGKVAREVVESRMDAVDLIKRLNFVEILQRSLLDQHQEVLLPLALLGSKKSPEGYEETTKADEIVWSPPSGSQRQLSPPQPKIKLSLRGFDQPPEIGDKENLEFSDYEKAYKYLKNLVPDNIFKEALREKLIMSLEAIFEPEKSKNGSEMSN